MRAAEIDLEPIVIQAHPQAVADQARGHAVEHLAQDEAAGRGDGDDGLLVIGGAPVRQLLEGGALDLDALGQLRALRRPTTSSMKRR